MGISREAKRIYDAARYAAKREEIKARTRAYWHAHKPPPKRVPLTPEQIEAKKAEKRRKQRKWKAAWLAANPEKRVIYRKKYAEKAKATRKLRTAKDRAICRNWYARNRLTRLAKLAARPPEVKKAAKAIRRLRERSSDDNFTAADLRGILRMQRGKCAECRTDISRKYHADHIMPLALGGNNSRRNIQLLCPGCNLSKSWKHPLDFAREHGRLL